MKLMQEHDIKSEEICSITVYTLRNLPLEPGLAGNTEQAQYNIAFPLQRPCWMERWDRHRYCLPGCWMRISVR